MNIKSTIIAASAATLFLQAPSLLAQDATPAPSASASASPTADASPAAHANAGGDRFAEFRQRMNDRLKTELKASDDEWAVIQPLLEKVQDAQRATMMGRFGGFGGGGRRGGGGPGGNGGGSNTSGTNGGNGGGGDNNRPNRPSSPEVDALHTALAADGTSDDDIKAKLQAVRDARKKTADTLQSAREDLRKVLTMRQEAVLVEMGILD